MHSEIQAAFNQTFYAEKNTFGFGTEAEHAEGDLMLALCALWPLTVVVSAAIGYTIACFYGGGGGMHQPKQNTATDFECEYNCGFDGSKSEVDAHEVVCMMRSAMF